MYFESNDQRHADSSKNRHAGPPASRRVLVACRNFRARYAEIAFYAACSLGMPRAPKAFVCDRFVELREKRINPHNSRDFNKIEAKKMQVCYIWFKVWKFIYLPGKSRSVFLPTVG